MKIFLCASMSFYPQLIQVESQLEDLGHQATIPVSAQEMKKSGDFDPLHYKGVHSYEQRAEKIRRNFDMIKDADAILVINNEKNGIKAYIGANVLMEISIAFYFKKKIFIWNKIAEDATYREELLSFGIIEIDHHLEQIHV